MTDEIDNFAAIRSHLTFTSVFDRYIVHIIKRAKDESGKKYGTNETNRLLKTFYITSLEYFDKKVQVIKDLCISNSARAYLLPQVRSNEDCLKELLKIVVDNLSNPTIKPDHLVRSAYCGYHGSRDKKWILDLDDDNLSEYICLGDSEVKIKTWTPTEVLEFVQKQLAKIGKATEAAYMLPTKNGHSIVTAPFDLQNAYMNCSMLFQGESRIPVELKSVGPGEYEMRYSNKHGWLIKDGMALLYCPNFDMHTQTNTGK